MKNIKNQIKTFIFKHRQWPKIFLVFILVFCWLFSGWPQIWHNPPFPPKIKIAQAAVSYVGGQVGSFAGKTSATTVTFALTNGSDSKPQAGDLVIVAYSVGSDTSGDVALTIKNASSVDYTLAGSELYQDDSYNSNLRVAYRFMPATPETTMVLSSTGSTRNAATYTIHVFRNVDSSTPLDVAAVTAGNINTRLADPGAILPTTSGAWIYVAGGAACATGGNFTAAYLTDLRVTTSSDTVDSNIASGYVTWTSGTYNPAAFGGGGTDTTSDSWNAVTLALRPVVAPTVSTQAASSVESTTATGNGTIEATGGQNATAWGVCYKISSGCTTADSVAAGSGTGGQGAFTASMTGLIAGTTYYIKAYATNSAGTSYGSEVTILTKPAAPTSLNFTSVTATTLRLNWTAPTGAASYKVERCTGTGCSSWAEITTGVLNTYYDDTGRTGNTIYRYQVRATNATGDGAYSSGAEQLMLPDVPTSFNFANVLGDSLTVNWTAPTGGAASYKVERCQGSGCTPSQITSGVTDLFYNNSGLTANTLYRYRIRATNATGDGAYSAIGEQTTQVAVVSVTLSEELFDYGIILANAASSTLALFSGAGIVATNNGNVIEDFDIYGADTTGWTLDSSTSTLNHYKHQFCNDTDNDCSTPPTSYTAMSTSTATSVLKEGVAATSGTVAFQLRITTPQTTDVYIQQSAAVTVQASAQ